MAILERRDVRALRFLRTRGHSAVRERVIGAYSRLGEHGGCWLAVGGLSRPYLGVHYPSDVVAGALLGTAVAELWP